MGSAGISLRGAIEMRKLMDASGARDRARRVGDLRWMVVAERLRRMPPILPLDATTQLVLRHVAATLAYRAAKVLRDVPPAFAHASFGEPTRHPVQIVAHMADLMAWGITIARGDYVWKAEGSRDWSVEVARFFDNLAALDRELSSDRFAGSPEQLIQGPLADALTHVGQLAMLRGMAGAPVRPESYARAQITPGRVGFDQPPPGREFDGDASAR